MFLGNAKEGRYTLWLCLERGWEGWAGADAKGAGTYLEQLLEQANDFLLIHWWLIPLDLMPHHLFQRPAQRERNVAGIWVARMSVPQHESAPSRLSSTTHRCRPFVIKPPAGASFRSGESGRMATAAAALAAISRMFRPGCTDGVAEAVKAAASAGAVAAASCKGSSPVFDVGMSMRCNAVPRLAPLSSEAALGAGVATLLLLRSVSRLSALIFCVWSSRGTGKTLDFKIR